VEAVIAMANNLSIIINLGGYRASSSESIAAPLSVSPSGHYNSGIGEDAGP
jgi:hypothetical protein